MGAYYWGGYDAVLTLQQIVLSKNMDSKGCSFRPVLTLQQIVLSKNKGDEVDFDTFCFDFTTNCSF